MRRTRPGARGRSASQVSFQLFVGGQSVSLLGDGLAVLVVPLLVLELTDDPVLAAVAAAPRYVAYIVVGLPAGALVDRWSPRRVMLMTDGIRAGVFVLLAVLASSGRMPPYVPVALAVVAAASGVFFETALNVAIRDLADEDDGPGSSWLTRASAYLELASQGSVVLGPALAGLLVATVGIEVALVANAATFVVSAMTIVAVRLPAAPSEAGVGRRLWGDVRVGLHYLRRAPVIRFVTAMQASANFLVAVESLVVFTAHGVLHLSPLATSVVVASSGLGGVVGAALAMKLVAAFDEASLFVACLAAVGVALAVIGLGDSMVWVVVANLAIGTGVTIAIVAVRVLRLRVVPRAYLGRVTASTKVFALIPQPIGVVVAGALTSSLGGDPRPVFLGAGLLTVLMAGVSATRLSAPYGPREIRGRCSDMKEASSA